MNIAIVDDEVHCVESLSIHLNALFPDMNIVFKTNKVHEALDALPQLDIDLLFLDIEMPGLSGFQLLEQLPDRTFDVIFTTAYSQYAVQAFKIKAIDYLMKPIDEEELKATVEEWEESAIENKDSKKEIEQLIAYLKREGLLKTKIAVPISDGYEFVEVDSIMYCHSQSNYTQLHLCDGSKRIISKTLKEFEKTLGSFFFIRVHQSYIINPNFLKEFHRQDGGFLVMDNEDQIPVSNQKRKLITDFFEAI